jgi:hypothetical protein
MDKKLLTEALKTKNTVVHSSTLIGVEDVK